MNDVAPSRELDRVPTGTAAGIKDLRAWQDPAIDQPGSDHSAFFTNRPIDKEVERPRVLGVEGTTRDFAHADIVGRNEDALEHTIFTDDMEAAPNRRARKASKVSKVRCLCRPTSQHPSESTASIVPPM